MSRENIEVVRAGFDAWNAGDMEAYGELMDPEVTWHSPPRWPEPGPFVGREAVLRQCIRLRDAWDSNTAEPTADFADVGDRVVGRMVLRSQSEQGPEMNMEISCVYEIRDGKHASFAFFWDHAEALNAAGLSE